MSWPRQDPTGAGQAVPPRTDPVAVSTAAVPTDAVAATADTPGSEGTPGTPTASAAPTAVADVVVHVAGQVAHPGLVTLPAGSRVAEAIAAAGGAGAAADLDRVNLARPLVDGEQVLVPAPGEAVVAAPGSSAGAAAAAGGAAGGSAAAGPLDLNAATEGDLDALPGVGEVLAGRILAWRTEHTRFSDVEELGEVRGIGPKLLDGLRPLVRV
ncbi:ComEA family DNA-binding protein [Kineosporiaceae bacterium B12]|nr:ComEA family DNA-binding protein [Kineococcus rubinsiae]